MSRSNSLGSQLTDAIDVTSGGKPFQTRVPAIGKALAPTVDRLALLSYLPSLKTSLLLMPLVCTINCKRSTDKDR